MKNSRTVLLLIAALCFLMLGVAMYLQHAMNMAPCPLCVIQRYLFLAIGIACLAGAAPQRPQNRAGLGRLAAPGGRGGGAHQRYVLANPRVS
ncbi:MAG: disulfide bond formation protein B, partial [Janthinobacterium sp.]